MSMMRQHYSIMLMTTRQRASSSAWRSQQQRWRRQQQHNIILMMNRRRAISSNIAITSQLNDSSLSSSSSPSTARRHRRRTIIPEGRYNLLLPSQRRHYYAASLSSLPLSLWLQQPQLPRLLLWTTTTAKRIAHQSTSTTSWWFPFLPSSSSWIKLTAAATSSTDNDNDDKNKEKMKKKTAPRGFEQFFPDDHDGEKKEEEEDLKKEKGEAADDAAVDKTTTKEDDDANKSSTTFESTSSSQDGGDSSSSDDNNNKKQRKNKKKKRKDQQPPPEDDAANLPGLLALLIFVVSLRQYLESEERNLGQEITFVDFRNQFLLTGKCERLEVVNHKMARVILKRDAIVDGGSSVNAGGGSVGGDATGGATEEFSSVAPSTSKSQHQQQASHYYFYIGSVESLEEKLTRCQADKHPEDWVEVIYTQRTNWGYELIKIVPFLAIGAAFYFGSKGMMGGMMGGRGGPGGAGGSNIFSVGKSTHKQIKKEDIDVTFADVAGCDEAKREIMEFVDFLKDAERFTKLGAKIPKGALLCGPPGTGKTLLARAVAGEAGVPFYSISGSDFIEMFVGVGPSRVRDLFKEARNNAPCIVFIDEIDAVGRQRGRGGFSGGGNDERENTLNQLLVEMDGFTTSTGVVVLAGTNRVDILDQALTRPGRFDRQVQVDRPDLQGRKDIFKVHLGGITLAGPVEEYAGRLAGLTPGFAGADIENICNEAAIVAARRKAEAVTMEDFEKATDRIIGGLESNKIMSDEERSIVAHHEAGHAVAGWFLEHADPLLKVTIIPRSSGALGFAQYLPKEVFLRSQDQIMDLVSMALAGRAAEDVFFGQVTTGASDDLRRVTQLVYSTIKDYGMNQTLGQLAFPQGDSAAPGDKPYSDSTAEAMDDEARLTVDAAYERTVALIRDHKEDVEKVAKLLLEKETITHDDLVDLIGPRPFQGDSAYQEFVSKRHLSDSEKDDDSASVADKDDDKKGTEKDSDSRIDGDGLTPGLA